MKYPICSECVFRSEPHKVCQFCDEGDQFEEDGNRRDDADELEPGGDSDDGAWDDGDNEGFGL